MQKARQQKKQQQQKPLTQQQKMQRDKQYIKQGFEYIGGFLHPDKLKEKMPVQLRKWNGTGDKRDFEIKKLMFLLTKTIQEGYYMKNDLMTATEDLEFFKQRLLECQREKAEGRAEDRKLCERLLEEKDKFYKKMLQEFRN